jgi:pimeloyl-ACP methyl ester carboxylesterase
VSPDPIEARALRVPASDGLTLSVLEWRTRWAGVNLPRTEAPILLLHHGFGHSGRIWQPFAEALCDRYRVLALDARGHGDSDRDPGGRYLHRYFEADLRAVVAALGIHELAIAAHSLGGYTALRFLRDWPGRLTHLVLIETPAEIAAPSGGDAEKQRAEVQRRYEAALAERYASAEDYAARLAKRHPRASRERLLALANAWLAADGAGRLRPKLDPETLPPKQHEHPETGEVVSRHAWAVAESAYIAKCLDAVTAPVLVVRGGDSPLFWGEVQARMVAGRPERRAAVVPGAGHVVALDAEAELCALLVEFLSSD